MWTQQRDAIAAHGSITGKIHLLMPRLEKALKNGERKMNEENQPQPSYEEVLQDNRDEAQELTDADDFKDDDESESDGSGDS